MPIKKYATIDEIPEAHRGDALELKNGEFALLEDPDTSGLSTALQSEREKREAAERLAKKAADDLKRLQTEKKAADAGLSAEQLAKIREEVRADVLKELEPDLVKGKTALEENRALKLDQRVKAIALKQGVRADRVESWWKLNRDRFDLTDDGEAPIVKGQPGSKLETFVGETLKKETPEFYEGTKAAGSDARTGSGQPLGVFSADDVIKNPAAALSAVRAQGKAA
jgi:phage-related protein